MDGFSIINRLSGNPPVIAPLLVEALLRTGPTVFPVLEARVAVIDVFHLDVSGSVDHLARSTGANGLATPEKKKT